MAATRAGDTFGMCLPKIAIDPFASTTAGRAKCARLGDTAMIGFSIFWALVFALFVSKDEQANGPENKPRTSQR